MAGTVLEELYLILFQYENEYLYSASFYHFIWFQNIYWISNMVNPVAKIQDTQFALLLSTYDSLFCHSQKTMTEDQ